MRLSEVLKKLHFPIEVNHKCSVLLFAKNLIQEAIAGTAFLAENTPLAQAGIYEKANR